MATIAAILGVVGPLLGLLAWWIKRKRAPTKEEQIQDLHNEKNDTIERVRTLREEGNNEQADIVLDRIRTRSATGWMHDNKPPLL